MKTFKVNVDGQDYKVRVEEITGPTNDGSGPVAKAEPVKTVISSLEKSAPEGKRIDNSLKEELKDKPKPAAAGGFIVKAPMPGSVIEVMVKEGDTVSDGDVLLVLEAMKMENELTAQQAGTVAEILIKKGDTVNSGDPLIVLS